MNSERRALLGALVLLALSALALHALAHPILQPDAAHPGTRLFRGSFVPASLFPLLDVVVVSWLFAARRTAPYAFLLNGLFVIYGTVLMGHYGIAALASERLAGENWFFKSNLLDIALAWADFLAGKALYESWVGASSAPRAVREADLDVSA